MLLKTFALYNSKTESYGQPLYFKLEQECVSALADFVNNRDPKISPTEFDLYYLGMYDTSTAKHELLKQPTHKFNLRTLTHKTEKVTTK